jgi:hypothetical protein
LLQCKSITCRSLSYCAETMKHAKGLVAFLLVMQSVFAYAADGVRKPPSSGPPQRHAILFWASSMSMAGARQIGTAQGRLTANSPTSLEAIQIAIDRVRSSSLQSLAGGLGLHSAQIGRQAFEDSTIGMEAVSGLGVDQASTAAVKWRPSDPNQGAQTEPDPRLYLLSWDGKGWQASYLTPAADALTLQVLPVTGNTVPLFAVVIFRGIAATPYPVIFRFRDHRASIVWDGRADSSLYTGYDYGSVQFEKARSGNVPVMVAAGRADPGLLIFPTSDEQSRRGFQAATVYVWHNDGYVPFQTEYAHNRDYTIYRFIAALHLHDFKAAYSLIDPKQFLKTVKPSLDLFRKRIQDVWPEFTDDQIFEVPAGPEKGSENHLFILRLGHGEMNVYRPTFTSGPAYRLVGLDRTKASE